MKSSRILKSAIATAMALPLLASPIHSHHAQAVEKPPVVQVSNSQKLFKDLAKSYPYYKIIYEMQDQGIINGYPDGTFKPNQTLSRQHAAVLINRALKVNELEIEKIKDFKEPKDLPKTHPYFNEIKLLMEAGLLEVDKEGKVNPTKPLTRGEMAKILTVAFNLEVKADYLFEDVKGTGYEEYIKALYSNGVTTGYEDNTFRVDGSLTRGHYAVFMYRSMNLDEDYVAEPIPKPEQPKQEQPAPSTSLNKEAVINSLVGQGFYKISGTGASYSPFGGSTHSSILVDLKNDSNMSITLVNWVDPYIPETNSIPSKLDYALKQIIPSGASHIHGIASQTAVTGSHSQLNKTFTYNGLKTKVTFMSGSKPAVIITFSK